MPHPAGHPRQARRARRALTHQRTGTPVSRAKGRVASRGFTYLGVMYIVVLLGLTSAVASVVWSTVQRRDNERELIFVGRQFQAAIERYRQADQGPAARYPRKLEELVVDQRSALPRHHLRQLYPDPITGLRQWGLIRLPDGGIAGVHSLSDRTPLRRSPPTAGQTDGPAGSYRQWRFVAVSALESMPAAEPPIAAAEVEVLPATAVKEADVPAPTAAAEDSPIARVQRPRFQDFRLRGPEACDRIVAFDRQTCADHAARAGDAAGASCLDSALQRNLACALADDAPLPALVMSGQ